MSHPKPEAITVGAVVFDDDERVLLVRRGKAPLFGEWTLVGGHVEAGESCAEATRREVYEETGLDVVVLAFLETVIVPSEARNYVIHEHLCAPAPGASRELRAGDDAQDARWVEVEDVGSMGVRPRAIAVVRDALLVWRRAR